MVESNKPLSEAEVLDSFLTDLERNQEVREIAGWDSGFPSLDRTLNGILPGLYLLIGPPSCGKTSFAKQLCDQVVQLNSIPALFFSFAETKKDLRIRTLARLSQLENREIRRGRAFLLHSYGMPKGRITEPEQMPPSWERLEREAEGARGWMGLLYLFECSRKTTLQEVENMIREVRVLKNSERIMIVIDDCHRLGPHDSPLDARLPILVEKLQNLALEQQVSLLAIWPDLRGEGSDLPPAVWAEKVATADVIFFMENDAQRTKKLTEPNRAVQLHIVKNRGGEKGTLAFDFMPAFSKFAEVTSDTEP